MTRLPDNLLSDGSSAPPPVAERDAFTVDASDPMAVGWLTADRQAVIHAADREAACLLGVDPELLVGRPLTAFIPTSPHRLEAHFESCLASRRPVTCELTLKQLDGTALVVQMTSRPLLPLDDAKPVCATSLTDVSRLKQIEQRLRLLAALNERLTASWDRRAILPASAALMTPLLADWALIDVQAADGRIERFDRRGSSIVTSYGRSPQAEVLRTQQTICLTGADSRMFGAGPRGDLAAADSYGGVLMIPLVARERTLGVFTCMFTKPGRTYSSSEQHFAGEIAARVAMAIDNARLYERLRAALRARDDSVALVAHDLYGPLQAVGIHCERLAKTAGDGAGFEAGRLSAVRRIVKHMTHMVRQLSETALIEAGQLVLDRADQPVAGLMRDALELVGPLAADKELALAAPSSLPKLFVSVDRERVLRVLSNVIGNAIKFSPRASVVVVEAVADDGFVRFSVTDRGPGIDSEQSAHVFERYWRTQGRGGGSGLGLYIAKSVVEAHGGRIGLESLPARGTTVWFTLPISRAVEPELASLPRHASLAAAEASHFAPRAFLPLQS